MKRELAMGINVVEALLEASPERLIRAWIQPTSDRLGRIQQRLSERGIATEVSDARALDRLSGRVRHQGVIVEFQAREPLDEAALENLLTDLRQPLVLVLDGITDPHNLGACIRSAAAAGAHAVVVPKDRAAGLTPVVRRAAAGATERIPLAMVTNLARTLRMLAERGFWRVGLDGQAEASLYEAGLDQTALAVVLGSEGRGMRRLTRELCDEVVRIPMPGAMESLNVSVAAGIVLFEAVRCRSHP